MNEHSLPLGFYNDGFEEELDPMRISWMKNFVLVKILELRNLINILDK